MYGSSHPGLTKKCKHHWVVSSSSVQIHISIEEGGNDTQHQTNEKKRQRPVTTVNKFDGKWFTDLYMILIFFKNKFQQPERCN